MLKPRGAKTPDQFNPFFGRVAERVLESEDGKFEVEVPTKASANSTRTQWYAYVRALYTTDPEGILTKQVGMITCRSDGTTVTFIDKSKTAVALAFKAALDAAGPDAIDRAYDAAIKKQQQEQLNKGE